MSELLLRKATLPDALGIVALLNAAYRGDSSRQGWTTEADFLDGQRTDVREVEATLSDPNAVLLVLDDGGIAGTVQVQRRGTEAYVGMLAVSPRLQARGHGRRLLEAAEQVAVDAFESETACMWVLTVRDELLAWYARRGYEARPARLAFPHADERFGIPKRPDLEFCLLAKELVRSRPHR